MTNENKENNLNFRILTHSGCSDGFYSAWIVKRYFNELTGQNLTREQITQIPVLGQRPAKMQTGEIELTEFDIVLDLPLPEEKKVFMWVDHHSSAKPKRDLHAHEHWELLPSCTGQLITMLKNKGVEISKELEDFKIAMDKNDSADYTSEEIKESYYQQDPKHQASTLLKAHILSSFVHTRDIFLNNTLLENLTKADQNADSPLSDKQLLQVVPELFHQARLTGHVEWREQVDTYIKYNEEHKTIVQDNRLVRRTKGIVDRFYQYIKFPQASYGMIIKDKDEDLVYFGIGCNIFHKDRCKIDIGKLCKDIATKFGTGGGGGHKTVGGADLNKEHTEAAIAMILETIQNADKSNQN